MRRVAIAFVLLMLLPGSALADAPDDVATRVSQKIMSPFCDGVTLHDCPSAEADQLRERIASMARDGMTDEQIIRTLEREYGDRISGTPGSPLAWIVPLLAVLAGIVLIAALARKWAKRPRTTTGTSVSEEDRARLETELAAHRGRS